MRCKIRLDPSKCKECKSIRTCLGLVINCELCQYKNREYELVEMHGTLDLPTVIINDNGFYRKILLYDIYDVRS